MKYYCISGTWEELDEALNEYAKLGWTVFSIMPHNAVYRVVLQRKS